MGKDGKILKEMLVCPRCNAPLERVVDWSIYKFGISESGIYRFTCKCAEHPITITIVSK
jgi:hypothetical protein